jgi:4-amino-4-deoxy-L-arabinose transferase-like glycosyltransferase
VKSFRPILQENKLFALLPLFSYLILVASFLRKGFDSRRAVVFASIPCGLFVAIGTELLSAFSWVTRAGFALSWTAFATAALLILIRYGRHADRHTTQNNHASEGNKGSLAFRIQLLGIVLLATLVGLTAFVCAPNNWDAMEYHMPRVFMWIQHANVGLYPTIDRQQLDMPPWAEYAMLHADLLYGGDRLVNLIQWFSFIGCTVCASLIAKELGGGRQAQLFAAVLAATIPSAVLGASGPKNDCVLAYWVILAAYFLLTWRREQSWMQTIGLASTFGLAIFTKGNAFLFLPGIVIACFLAWPRQARLRFLARLPVVVAICLVMMTPFWSRNYQLSGSILGLPYFDGAGPVEGRMFGNSRITLATAGANMIRNIGLHLGTPSARVNAQTTELLSKLIRILGVDPNQAGQLVASQFGYIPEFRVAFGWRNEVFAANPIHLLLFGAAILFWLFGWRHTDRFIACLGLSVIAGFVLYSALLRWGPWNARYQLALFVLAAPFTALVLIERLPARAMQAIAYLLLLVAVPAAASNQSRPLLTRHGFRGSIFTASRDETYFLDWHREMTTSFESAATYVTQSNCKSIGLDTRLLRFDYPIMALISKEGRSPQITYADVQPSTTRFTVSAPPSCMIVCLGCVRAPEKWQQYGAGGAQGSTFGDYVGVMSVAAQVR